MTLYIVTAAHLDQAGEVESVLWAQADGTINRFSEQPYAVPVDRVVEAFDRGDFVEMVFPTPKGNVSGGRLARKVLPNGEEKVCAERSVPGQGIADLPLY
ncbi:MAG: hypothetical protein Q8R06_18515 [Polaromonas sp.]|uniref:hypothetical protein n=1 Tax=Polaromonas sp. TaxID=1869339 RepID=UPI002734DC8A|nr:hypothetical protein [Polaromonas sp.]MDP3799107.1 hypothetical protein [Polaromonas sp.]